jgi:hypothetical protein
MRRYKVVACILILSVFGFVLAAPAAVQEVREARADGAVDGSENVIIGSGKRADSEEEPLLQSWAKHQGTSSAPNYASGTHPNPSFSLGDSVPPPLSTSGGIELPWDPLGLTKGGAKLSQPGTSTEIQPASLSKAKSVLWATPKLLLSGEAESVELGTEIKPLPVSPGYRYKPRPPEPKSKNIVSKLAGKLKFKVGKVKFRFSREFPELPVVL